MFSLRLRVAGLVVLAALLSLPAKAQLQILNYRPADAVYSTGLDRLVLVSSAPNELHLYDVVNQLDSVIALPFVPNCVSLSPDGLFAAIGHNGYVSWVDLQSRSVVRTVPFGIDVSKVVVASGFIYGVPRGSGGPTSDTIKYVAIGGTVALNSTAQRNLHSSSSLFASPDGSAIYAASTVGPYGFRYNVNPSGTLSALDSGLTGCGAWLLDATRVAQCTSVYVTDPKLLLFKYRAKLDGVVRTAALSQPRDELAAVLTEQTQYMPKTTDSELRLYSATTLGQVGQIPLPQFPSGAGSVKSRGRFVAYSNSGSKLAVIVQADEASGLAKDYAIITLTPAAECTVNLSSATLTIAGLGGRGSISVSATGGCLWQAATNATWLSTPRSNRGGDASTLQVFASPNPSTDSRTGTIKVGSQMLTVVQSGRSTVRQTEPLAYDVTDAAYSGVLDRLLMISSNPDQLHIYDAVKKVETATVELGSSPTSINVSPDGLFAAVSLEGRIVRINLQTAAITHSFLVPDPGSSIALSNTHIYSLATLTDTNYVPGLRATEISGGSQTMREDFTLNAKSLTLAPDAKSLFSFGDVSVQRWPLTAGLPGAKVSTSISSCPSGWFSADGLRLFTGCGDVYRLSDPQTNEYTLVGRLPNRTRGVRQLPLKGLLFSLSSVPILDVPESVTLDRYSYPDLAFQSKSPLPMFDAGGVAVQGNGQFLFADPTETNLHVILYGKEPLNINGKAGYAVYSTSVESQSGCTYSFSPQRLVLPHTDTLTTVHVVTQPGCSWTVSSNTWLTVIGSGVGNGFFNVHAPINSSDTTERSTTLQIGDASLIVVQRAASSCIFRVPPVLAVQSASSISIPVEATGGCSWSGSVAPGTHIAGTPFGTGSGSAAFFASRVPATPITANITLATRAVELVHLPANGCQATLSKVSFDAAGQTGNVTLSFSGVCPSTWRSSWTSSWLQMYPTSGSTASPQLVQLAVFPNFTLRLRSGIVALGNSIGAVSISQSASQAVETERFVGLAYFAAFGRTASQAEINFQIANALNKGVTRAELLKNFLNTAEFNFGGKFIAGLYMGLLKRDAEFDGWLFQRNALAGNQVNQDQLVTNFLNSEERRITFGTVSDAEFVRLLYRYVLLREGTTAEITGQTASLSGQSRTALARAFLNTPEFQIGANARLMAFLLHAMLLARDPTIAEMADAVNRITAGTSISTLVQELLDGPEFAALIK